MGRQQIGDRLARKRLEVARRGRPRRDALGRALRQDDPELGEQAADAIDGGGTLLDVALAHAVEREDGLLLGDS